jgi:hypothetical protein
MVEAGHVRKAAKGLETPNLEETAINLAFALSHMINNRDPLADAGTIKSALSDLACDSPADAMRSTWKALALLRRVCGSGTACYLEGLTLYYPSVVEFGIASFLEDKALTANKARSASIIEKYREGLFESIQRDRYREYTGAPKVQPKLQKATKKSKRQCTLLEGST